jgi:hypothetical protein
MSKLLLAVLLLISSVVFSQDSIDDMLRRSDSLNKEIIKSQAYSDSLRKKEDMDRMAERSADFFAQYQKDQNAKKKKQAIMYIAFGVAGIVVLIIGLRRRVKKPQ